MKKKSEKKSIFKKLIFSYFIFSTIAVLSIVICLLLEFMDASGGNLKAMNPETMVKEDGSLGKLDFLFYSGGWLEELDENYQVIQVYGEKKTEKMSYTADEILYGIKNNSSKEGYHIFVFYVRDTLKYLEFMPNDILTANYTYNVTEISIRSNLSGIHLLLLMILLSLDGVLISFYIYRKIRKPMKSIVDGMHQVEAGDKNIRLNFNAEGEFIEIQNAFNMMIERVEAEEAEKEKMQRDRQQMLLELSHDLKTPVATIKSYALALEAGVVSEEERKTFCHTINQKADKVNSMADDMFTMLKMESSDYKIEGKDRPKSSRQDVYAICPRG